MLFRFFYPQTPSILIVLFLLIIVGCGGKTVDITHSKGHPADPDSKHGTPLAHANMQTGEMHDGPHSSIELSSGGTEALAAMLEAYMAIGNQLASDTMEGVNAKAHAMLEAFQTVETEAPADLWNTHESHIKTIHDTGHQLGDLSDINAARIAYGSLSDSFKHFLDAAGVPANYEQTVYSYVCGMAPDVPRAGIWMQTVEPVRNPYFGSAMLRCHTTKTLMSASNIDMSDAMDMDSHKHSH